MNENEKWNHTRERYWQWLGCAIDWACRLAMLCCFGGNCFTTPFDGNCFTSIFSCSNHLKFLKMFSKKEKKLRQNKQSLRIFENIIFIKLNVFNII